MGIIYQCDGCNKQFKSISELNNLKMTLTSEHIEIRTSHDLCSRCEMRYVTMTDPKFWPQEDVT